jgi:hypothetical protein
MLSICLGRADVVRGLGGMYAYSWAVLTALIAFLSNFSHAMIVFILMGVRKNCSALLLIFIREIYRLLHISYESPQGRTRYLPHLLQKVGRPTHTSALL